MMNDLSSGQMRTFVTIADAGSYTRAAEILFLTQPALSLQIKRLEEQLGLELFQRSGRRTVVTEAGQVLLTYARRILRLNEEVVARLSVPDAEGLIRIGVLEEVALGPLVDLLTMFGRICTRIQIEFQVDTSWALTKRIRENSLCMAVANRDFANKDAFPLWSEPYVWVQRRDADFHLDDTLRLVMEPQDYPCTIRDSAVDALARIGKPWKIVFSTTSVVAIKAAVRAGLGIGMVARSAVDADFRILGQADGLPELPPAQIVLCRSREATGEAAETLADFLIAHLQKGPKLVD